MFTVESNIFAGLYLYFECMLLGTMLADAVAARYEPERDRDYMIVLGAQWTASGPSKVLKYRLDKAVEYLKDWIGERCAFLDAYWGETREGSSK